MYKDFTGYIIKEDYDLEIFYDTKEKIVKVYDYMGKNGGSYFSNELKLKLLKVIALILAVT